jgi:hypothetical protein
MNTSQRNISFLLLIMGVLILACGSGQLLSPASTPTPSATSTPTATSLPTHTPTPVPTDIPTISPTPAIIIETSEGALAVRNVEVVDRFPPGCDPGGLGCSQAAPGYIILIVWLENVDEKVSLDSGEWINMPIYVTGAEGLRTKIFAGGIYNGELFVAFTPPESAHDFVLDWPDSLPVELGQ